MNKLIFSFFVVFGNTYFVSAQDLRCPDISKTLKEYSIDSSSSSYLNAVFTQHCQQDGSRKSSGGGAGLDAVVKAIPIKFTGNYNSNDEAFSSFCKSYALQTASTAARDSYKETISIKALETIQQCNQLQASGVVITHQINNVEAANFYLRNSVTQNLSLQGISISGNVICEGLVNGKRKTLDSSLNLDVKSTFSFACKRTGQPKPPHFTYSFAESVITVLTNQGNYSLFWPKDERQSENMASAIDRRITATDGELAVTKAGIAPLVNAPSIPVYECPVGRSHSRDAKWVYVGCNGQITKERECINEWSNYIERLPCKPIGSLKLLN